MGSRYDQPKPNRDVYPFGGELHEHLGTIILAKVWLHILPGEQTEYFISLNKIQRFQQILLLFVHLSHHDALQCFTNTDLGIHCT